MGVYSVLTIYKIFCYLLGILREKSNNIVPARRRSELRNRKLRANDNKAGWQVNKMDVRVP